MMVTRWILVLSLAAPAVVAQHDAALRRAIVIEEQEHEVQQAVRLYREIAADDEVPAPVRARAWLRLGQSLRRLGEKDAAVAALREAARDKSDVGKKAAAILQGIQEGAKERALRERARRILEDPALARKREHLKFVGQGAMPEIVRFYERLWSEKRDDPGIARSELLALMWQLGGKVARDHLRAIRKSPEVAKRLEAVGQLQPNVACHPSVLVVALEFLSDAEAEVAIHTLRRLRWQGLKIESLLPLTGSKNPTVLQEVWRSLNEGGVWRNLAHVPHSGRSFQVITPDLVKSLASVDAGVAAAARRFLAACGTGSVASRRLLFRHMPEWSRETSIRPYWVDRYLLAAAETEVPDSHAADLVRVVRRLGRYDPGDQRRSGWLLELVRRLGSFSPAVLPEMLEMARLGYAPGIHEWLRAHKLEERGDEIIKGLDGSEALADPALLGWLCVCPLTKSSWPVLRRAWRPNPKPHVLQALARCIARTTADGAIDFLRDTGSSSPALHTIAAHAFLHMSRLRHDARVRAAMRALMSTRLEGVENGVYGLAVRLLALGDLAAARLIPAVNERHGPRHGRVRVDVLRARPAPFDRERLEVVWRLLLADHDDYWAAAAEGNWTPSAHVPIALFTELVGRRLRAYEANADPLPPGFKKLFERVLRAPGGIPDLDPRLHEPIRALYARLLAGSRKPLRLYVLNLLRTRKPKGALRRKVLELLRAADPEVAKLALLVVEDQLQLSLGELVAILPRVEPRERDRLSAMLPRIPLEADSERSKAVRHGRALLGRDSPAVRVQACRLLGRCVDGAAVPELLTALRDRHQDVRDAAASALRAIRFDREQRSFWGLAAAPNAPAMDARRAAQALLKQADARRKKATRLLAIRSLGVLGRPEVLPRLIEYTEDSDDEIADVATRSIALLHGRSGKGK